MFPWRRILIPTDFSTAAEWAFDDAIRMAGSTGAELIILHIRMARSSKPSELRFPADPSVYEYAERHELEKLQQHAHRRNSTIHTRLEVRQGVSPGDEIRRAAAELEADLIVTATHARHHVAHLIIGSTTLSVLSSPTAPVLAVRYGIPKRAVTRRIVVPVHPGVQPESLLDLVRAMALRDRAEVHLITVCPDADRAAGERHLATTASRFAGLETTMLAISGRDVEREVVRYCDDSGADLVALVQEADVEPGQIGPIAGGIIRHVDAPVLLVPKGYELRM
jgi:nucleotide-binding universal stress UspA family protein